MERPHRSARPPDRRSAGRDDVLLRAAAGRAGDRAHRRWPTCRALLTQATRSRPHRADGARAAALRHRPAAHRRGRPESARRRTRAVRRRGGGRHRGRRSSLPGARHRRRARFPATRSSCAPRAANSTSVVACYHDQGLIPVKLLAFGQAVNVTLGLPIVRTSVDHGTAFDIAGKGVADPASMIAAVLLAARLARSAAGSAEAGRYVTVPFWLCCSVRLQLDLDCSRWPRKPSARRRRASIAENRKAFHDYPSARDVRGRRRPARHRGQGDSRRPRQPARQLRAGGGRRGVPLQRPHQPVQPSRLRGPRAAAAAQAAAAPRARSAS